MSKKHSLLLATVSALVIAGSPVLAQNDANVTIVKPAGETAVENAAEATGNAVENAADATGNALQDAGQATENAAENAAQATENAAENAAQATENAAENAAQATENAAEATGNAVENAAESAGDAVDADVTVTEVDAAPAEGTPIEGQIFDQSADTFLASTLMDATVVNPAGDSIGDVNDMVVNSDGTIQGVVIGVGGFLGIGEKDVAIELDRLDITETDDELTFMLNATEEELKAAPEFVSAEEQRDAVEADAAAGAAMTPATTTTTTTTPAQ